MMNSEEIVVKNEPVCVDKPCGRPTRSVKRPSSKRSKSLRQNKKASIKSKSKEVQVKQEPIDAESSNESSHKCKIAFLRQTNELAEQLAEQAEQVETQETVEAVEPAEQL